MKPRKLAVQVLLRVFRDGQSLTAALETVLADVAEGQDKAFTQAMCYGVCRYYHLLDSMLERLLSKPLRKKDLDIRILLLLGLYQLRYMRVKDHAAVSETVAAAGKKSWAKSLINGVLRHYQREHDGVEQGIASTELAKFSHPQWMIRLFRENWPEQAESIMLANNEAAPMVLRVNLSRICREGYLSLLQQGGIAAHAVSCCPAAVQLEQAVSVDKLPGFFDGLVSVQDSAAQLAADLLDVQPGQAVLDVCAAPGGKTAAILERQPSLRSLLAVDVDAARLEKVGENLRRLQLQAELLCADASCVQDWAKGRRFERILLDAPCSALGVIRRHPDIKLLRRESDINELTTLQSGILDAAWQALQPGGILLYATCSILKQENEDQIAAFLSRHPDAEEIKIIAEWGQARPVGRQILGGDGQMDGFYYAKVRKTL
ncbi:16S rRNA (cytosine(967)-C(5))-methyltransferase RsmB [Methylomarinum vadi]|uniref:16S rRNA (cytosine(967)-C(5))-methyltransferase RsmB n=1 Tax=Methylomarinum vadi TaxID=438855 RepID=UPI0004DF44B3|nr:16S rRNA (cytosine(967)-C(5))-methyltransferase RsmB [Methylomarinum vadi]